MRAEHFEKNLEEEFIGEAEAAGRRKTVVAVEGRRDTVVAVRGKEEDCRGC